MAESGADLKGHRLWWIYRRSSEPIIRRARGESPAVYSKSFYHVKDSATPRAFFEKTGDKESLGADWAVPSD